MRSKRQRKEKDRNSLKRKRGALEDGFSTGLTASQDDPTPLVLPPRSSVAPTENAEARPKLSKAEQRKLRRIAEDKELKAQRQQVFDTLALHALPEIEQALLKPSTALGQKDSKRRRIEREWAMQKAGMKLPKDSQLERRRGWAESSDAAQVLVQEEDEPKASEGPRSRGHGRQGNDDDSSSGDDMGSHERPEPDRVSPNSQPPDSGATNPAALREAVDKARTKMGLPPLSMPPLRKLPEGAPHKLSGKARLVSVRRLPGIEEGRSQLPIIGMEQEIMEAVSEHDVIVLAGETGCGKTTQVPQFLYEAGFGCRSFVDRAGMIGVTQPRRVAAIASAQRVAAELGSSVGTTVGYQVRYDRKVGEDAAVKFMTDGILMREVQLDFLLQKYSCLVIDEAHERSLNTDLIIGMLSRIVPMRRKLVADGKGTALKLIIMSATLRTEDFVGNRKLFPQPPPLVTVPARQFPVTVHFNRRTELYDYVGTAFAKVSQIHRQLPPGGILVFLTGQREVEALCKRLRQSLNEQRADRGGEPSTEPAADAPEDGGLETAFGVDAAEAAESAEPFAGDCEHTSDDFEDDNLSEEEDTVLLGGGGFSSEELAAAEARLNEELGQKSGCRSGGFKRDVLKTGTEPSPVYVLPLYALLPQACQAKVFGRVPEGHRLIVVATNVAETSITIPGIRYVVDAGRAKQKLLEGSGSGMARFEVGWVSKASAEQRAGRAGRTAPGHCYRLFSSAVFNDQFAQHSPPEILNTALEGVVLVMKAMGIDKVSNFPFPTPPKLAGLADAQQCLAALGATGGPDDRLTALGLKMAGFPLSPRHARLIIQVAEDASIREEVLPLAVALAAVMSVESPFVHIDNIQAIEDGDAESAQRERQRARAAHARLREPKSDVLSALSALLAYDAAPNRAEFCRESRLHAKNLAEMCALHQQLRRLAAQKLPEAVSINSAASVRLTPSAVSSLRKAISAGWIDQVARRVHSSERLSQQGKPNAKKRAVRYRCALLEEDVYLHPESGLYAAAPQLLAYSALVRSAKRPYMTGITEIDAHWLVEFESPLCTISPPLEDPAPQYVVAKDAVVAWHDVSFGRHSWELPRTRRRHPDVTVRARAFAAALLDGFVLPSLMGLKPHLAAAPQTAWKLEAQGQPRVGRLIATLCNHGIDSKATLRAAWAKDSSLLRAELGAWVKKGRAEELTSLWAQLLQESRGKTKKRKKLVKSEPISKARS